ncbi:MAG: flagellar biosynthesis anti-sigma factor FlgM [Acidobacteriota bacterium]
MGKMNVNKIDSSTPIRVERQNDIKGPVREQTRSVAQRRPANDDRLDLSSQGSEVGNLVEQLKQMPEIRQDKVNSLREQVAAGTYRPSNQDIAKAIVNDEKA